MLGYIFYYCTFMSLRFLQLHFTSTCKKVRQRSRLKIKAISKVREKGSVKIFSRKYFFDIHVPQQYRNLLLFFSDPPLHKDVAVGVWRRIWAFSTGFHKCLTSKTIKRGPLKPPAVLHTLSCKYHAQRFKTAPNTTWPDYYRVYRAPQLECKYIYQQLTACWLRLPKWNRRGRGLLLARPPSCFPFCLLVYIFPLLCSALLLEREVFTGTWKRSNGRAVN